MRRLTNILAPLTLVAILAGSAHALMLATATGKVTRITYDATTGLATQFELTLPGTPPETKVYEIGTPNEPLSDNLGKWKDNDTDVTTDDVNDNGVLEAGDTVSES